MKSKKLKKIKKPLKLNDTLQANFSSGKSKGVRRRNGRSLKRNMFVIICLILLLAGGYMVYLLMFPKVSKTPAKTISEQARQEPAKDVDTIFIPSANIKADISEGDINVLDKGLAWHRLPERGTPPTGGNTIITGHSFVWGTTPGEIKKKSIFYDLEKTKLGDEVTIHWDGKNYKYKVSEVKTVKPNALEIEKKTTQPTLTIYTCTLGGAADGRVVVVAKPESTN